MRDTSALAVLAITLERTACFGDCPTYTATLAEDGLVEWSGIANVPLLGEHWLEVGTGTFQMIADLVVTSRFFKWQVRCVNRAEDLPETRLTVYRGGEEETHWQHRVDDPDGFQLLATTIDGALCWPLWSNRTKT